MKQNLSSQGGEYRSIQKQVSLTKSIHNKTFQSYGSKEDLIFARENTEVYRQIIDKALFVLKYDRIKSSAELIDTPSTIGVMEFFKFLLSKWDPSLPTQTFSAEDIIDLYKLMDYPFPMNKNFFSPVGNPSCHPFVVQQIAYLCYGYLQSYQNSEFDPFSDKRVFQIEESDVLDEDALYDKISDFLLIRHGSKCDEKNNPEVMKDLELIQQEIIRVKQKLEQNLLFEKERITKEIMEEKALTKIHLDLTEEIERKEIENKNSQNKLEDIKSKIQLQDQQYKEGSDRKNMLTERKNTEIEIGIQLEAQIAKQPCSNEDIKNQLERIENLNKHILEAESDIRINTTELNSFRFQEKELIDSLPYLKIRSEKSH